MNDTPEKPAFTADSFQNFAAQLGYGTANQSAGNTYGFNPITRNRILLEWMYRGSWVVGVAVDAVAEDMTRAGIEILSGLPSAAIEKLQIALQELSFWSKLAETIRWSRLYGGAIGVMMIDGQSPSTPLRLDSIGKGMFKGLTVMDRWMLTPDLNNLVTDLGPDAGMPKYYAVIQSAPVFGGKRIHYSRVIRMDGIELPFQQRQTEQLWGISIIERLFDRLTAFDSTTMGAAQLVYKAHLRTLSIEKLRELIAIGGKAYTAVLKQVELIRLLQTNEGITLLDASDKFEAHQYAFSGLGDMMLQFAQQVAGALQIPLVRLLGQSPAGLNSTGESDFRNYYDGISSQQNARLRRPMHTILEVLSRSVLGMKLPPDFAFAFTPLWQMSALEKSDLAAKTTNTIAEAFELAIITKKTALEELRAQSRVSGLWTNISDEDIAQAALEPPPIPGQAAGSEAGDPSQPFVGKHPDAGATPKASVPATATHAEPPGTDDVTDDDIDETGGEGAVVTEIDVTAIPGGTEVDVYTAGKPPTVN